MIRAAVRCAALVGVSLILGAGHAVLRPLPPPPSPPSVPTENGVVVDQTATDELTIEAATQLYNNGAFFLDARSVASYTKSHVDGAFHLDPAAFRSGRPAVLDVLPTDLPLVIYCDGGDCESSHLVERMLHSFGYENTHVLTAGFPAWETAGLPTAAGEPEF